MQGDFEYEQYSRLPVMVRRTVLNQAVKAKSHATIAFLMATMEKDPEEDLRNLAEEHLMLLGIMPQRDDAGKLTFIMPEGMEQGELGGGDGLARPRDELLRQPELFLIHRRNQRYLESKTNMIAVDRFMLIVVLLIFGAVTVWMFIQKFPLLLVGVFALATLLIVWMMFNIWRRALTLERQGVLLQGQAASINGHWKISHNSNGSRSRSWVVDVSYIFKTPYGEKITAYKTQTRNDLRNKTLPPVGTPVAVLYVDRDLYELL